MESAIVDDAAGLTAGWLGGVLDAPRCARWRSSRSAPVRWPRATACRSSYADGDGPARLIAKLPSHDPSTRAQAALPYRAEVGFYRDLAPRLEVDAPRCWFAEVADDGTSFTLLLEDMAPATAGDQLTGCSPEEARAAAVAVAALHAGSWCDPSSSSFEWLIPPMSQMADLVGGRARGRDRPLPLQAHVRPGPRRRAAPLRRRLHLVGHGPAGHLVARAQRLPARQPALRPCRLRPPAGHDRRLAVGQHGPAAPGCRLPRGHRPRSRTSGRRTSATSSAPTTMRCARSASRTTAPRSAGTTTASACSRRRSSASWPKPWPLRPSGVCRCSR